jgi:S-adenosyl methyltransferase
VAVVLMAILHLIGDEDDPYGIVATLMDAVPPGSYLTLSHIASDIETEALGEARDRVSKLMPVKQTYRSHAEVMRFFDGLDMVEPGLVRVQQWRPSSEVEAKSPAALWGGVGRKR